MSTAPEAEDDTPSSKPAARPFRKRFDTPRLSAEAAARQGKVARLAWERFGENAAVIAFLNTHDEALGGRPIDLAVASEAGLLAVQQALGSRAGA